MTTLRMTEEHEWIRMDSPDSGTVGITHFAQEQLGDIVFVELPQVGQRLTKGDDAAVIESVKAAADCKAPVSGTVTEVNTALAGEPGKINQDPAGAGWFFKLKLDDVKELDALLDAAAYKAKIAK
jgi:glycine cleavage system H protein